MTTINGIKRTPSIEDFIEKELEKRLRERQSAAEKTLEELRPLCEELPPSVIDPISLEPFSGPMVARCGHTFDRESLIKMYRSNPLVDEIGKQIIHCPVCRGISCLQKIYYELAFEKTIDHLEKIKEVFNKHVVSKQTKSNDG